MENRTVDFVNIKAFDRADNARLVRCPDSGQSPTAADDAELLTKVLLEISGGAR